MMRTTAKGLEEESADTGRHQVELVLWRWDQDRRGEVVTATTAKMMV